MRNRETEPHARHAIKFAEGSQHNQRIVIGGIGEAFCTSRFDKGFIHDEQAVFTTHRMGQRQQGVSIRDTTIGIVGIDHHRICGC